MKKLVLIDGNSLLNRAYYATPIFTTRSGMPTNAIFGFVKLMFKILDDEKPEYLIVAFDLKAPTFRHKMFTEYKANRKGMPDDLAAQVEPLKNLLKAMNVAMCSKEGLEADDIIGTLSNKFDVHSYIYTGDRDSFQLVNEKTDVFYTKRGVSDLQKLNIDNFKEEIGLMPSQIVDLKALMGDKSDNIPGVQGIGEKTAYDLLGKFSSLDGVYAHIEEIKGAVKDKLLNNKDSAYLSYKLATIDRNCDIELDLASCAAPYKYGEDVITLFKELEFNSFLGLDIYTVQDVKKPNERNYPEKIVCKSLNDFESALNSNPEFCVYLDENLLDIYVDGREYLIKNLQDLSNIEVNFDLYFDILKSLFSDSGKKIITFEYKAILHLLKKFGIESKCAFEDIDLMKYLCDYNSANLDFKGLCEYKLFDIEYPSYAISELYNEYLNILKEEDMLNLYNEIEKPLLSVLFDMEDTGVKVSREMLDELDKRYEMLAEESRQKIYEACGTEFNINSPAQLGEVLYTKLGLTEVKKKKTNKYTTSADVLDKLKDKSPVIDEILKYRMYQKLYSTYLEGYKPLIDKKTSLVHTTYNQTLTVTGRLSSANPNLQNIPIRDDEGKEIRKIFVPREGNKFIDADYSQIELRLLAHFSDCKELIEAYNNGVDIHSLTASQVFGVAVEDVTSKMRREAKAVNFGIIYGLSDFGLSRNLNIPLETARDYIDKYFKTYSKVKDYMMANVEYAKKYGYVATLTGRKRVITEIRSTNFNIKQFGERAAMNMPLQGSSADIIKIAMVNVFNSLKNAGLKTKLILQVHDELVLDSPEEEVEEASKILKYEMENAVKLKVPLTVDVHTGKNWYDAK